MTERWPAVGPLIRAQPLPLPDGGRLSGIDKQEVAEPLWLGPLGLAGDQVRDRRWHGGADRALCVYPQQHYRRWQTLFGLELGPGAFGENLCCDGLDEHRVGIGDRLRWGEALLEVSQPRSPCVTLDRRHGRRGLARALAQSGRTGWLCRVLEPGRVPAGAPLQREHSAAGGISVAELWRLYRAEQADEQQLSRLSQWPVLAEHYRDAFRRRLDQARAQRDQHRLFD